MKRIRFYACMTFNFTILAIQCLPALIFWVLSGFSLNLDFRDGPADPIAMIPGWSRNELVWNLSNRWFLDLD